MRMLIALMCCMTLVPAARAQAPFDACSLFTPEEAERALGASIAPEPMKPRKARIVTACSYRGVKEGLPVEASANFRFARTDEEAERAFDEARMSHQTKPFLISGAEAFWSTRTGEMNVRKGRAWLTLSVGPDAAKDRDVEHARKLAEMLARKL